MFDHVSIGIADLEASRKFYDSALAPLGYRCLYKSPSGLGYGDDKPRFWLDRTDSPVPADPRSGLHVCFRAPTRQAVAAFHVAALANGGRDNGPPGLRPQYTPNYFAAFVFDPDGYRIEAVCFTGE